MKSEKIHRARINELRRSIRSDIHSSSYLAVRYAMEHIERDPSALAIEGLSHGEIVETYRDILNEHIKK